jgi:O-acetyl-ADP-ribose deacetylase (regulator of RNase III)
VKKIALLIFSILTFATAQNFDFSWPWEKKIINPSITYTIKNDHFPNAYKIILIQGDLLNLDTLIKRGAKTPYTIVNAANKYLYLGSGIAGAIRDVDKSGAVQKACNSILQKKGKNLAKPQKKKAGLFDTPLTFTKYMPTGSAWLTTSGDLLNKNIQGIIHAVSPNCQLSEEKANFEELLRMTYSNIFATVIQYNTDSSTTTPIHTVACPSLSTGIFRCKLEKAATVAAETIVAIMANSASDDDKGSPTIFVMVTHDDKHFKIYKDAFQATDFLVQEPSYV